MSLIDSMMEKCCIVVKTSVPDTAGGRSTTWTNGNAFKAAITLDSTNEKREAEKPAVTATYIITTSRSIKLKYNDVIKRLSDGTTFRVTSNQNGKISPEVSTLDLAQVTAEEWRTT